MLFCTPDRNYHSQTTPYSLAVFLKMLRKPKPQTDADYVLAYRQSGDLAVLGELYERHMELVYAVCYQHLRDEDEAKDAVMQIFEELIEKLRQHEVSNFKSWLHSVARNYCLMALRSQKRKDTDALPDEERTDFMEKSTWVHQTDEDWDLEAQLQGLGECLEQLNAEQKASVTLFFLKELSYKQIAEQTGFDLNKVKSFIQNGKRNLRICLEGRSLP